MEDMDIGHIVTVLKPYAFRPAKSEHFMRLGYSTAIATIEREHNFPTLSRSHESQIYSCTYTVIGCAYLTLWNVIPTQ